MGGVKAPPISFGASLLGVHFLYSKPQQIGDFMNAPVIEPTKAVLVTTAHRGVFAGLVTTDQDMSTKWLSLKEARMAIYWGTTRGVMELAETGPTSKSKISARADLAHLHDVTAIFEITDAAWQKWLAA